MPRQTCNRCDLSFQSELTDGLCPRCLLESGVRIARELRGPRESGTEDASPVTHAGGKGSQSADAGKTAFSAECALVRSLGASLGDYELLDELGRGGMGVVFKARQISLNRTVALKVMRGAGFASPEARQRFHAEAETAAGLQHPNIVSVYDSKEVDGHPCFSMEWVRGRSLAEIARDTPLPPRRAARYLAKIAKAVDHAHARGILHRDLKPSNVLIDEHDEPRITDFGLARHLGIDSKLTLSGQMVGSPNFMAPEQAGGDTHRVGPRSDVYGLGATLFTLLTGRPPFHAATVTETLRQLAASEPASPRMVNPSVPRDLETLCLKCLEKEPQRRYGSARDVADELERFLRNEPIHARPLGPTGRLRRWALRKPVLAGLLMLVLLLTVIIVAGTPVAILRIQRAQDRAETEAAHKARLLYVADMNIAFQALRDGRLDRVRQLLQAHRPGPGEEDLRSWEWGHLWHESRSDELWTLPIQRHQGWCVAYSPDGRWIAAGGWDGTVRVFDLKSQRKIVDLDHSQAVYDLQFAPDPQRLIAATISAAEAGNTVRIWDVTTWREVGVLTNVFHLPSLAVSTDGLQLAISGVERTSGQPTAMLVDLNTARPLGTLDESNTETPSVGWSPNASILPLAGPGGINIWSLEQRSLLHRIPLEVPARGVLPMGPPLPLALSPDQRTLAVGGVAPRLFDLEEQRELRVPTNDLAAVSAAAFSPDGKHLATAHVDPVIRIWTCEDWSLRATLKGHRFPVADLAFSPDGKSLASASDGDSVKVWSATQLPARWPVELSPPGWLSATATAGDLMVWWFEDNSIEIRNAAIPGIPPIRRHLPVDRGEQVHGSPGGRWLCFADQEGRPGIWETRSMKLLKTLPGDRLIIDMWCFSPDETKLALIEESTRSVVLFSVPDGEEIARRISEGTAADHRAWWGADSRTLMVAAPQHNGVLVWDFQQGVVRAQLRHPGEIRRVITSRDATHIATLDSLGSVKVWSAKDYRELWTFAERGPLGFNTLFPVSFSADNRRLAVVDRVGEVRIYDLLTGQEITILSLPGVLGCGFSSDGAWMSLGTTEAIHFLPSSRVSETDR